MKSAAPPVARGAVQLGTLLWQIVSTSVVLFVVSFLVLMASGYADAGLGALLLCLIVSGVAAMVGTAFAVIVGLPLRLSRRARLWWIRHGELAFVGLGLGAVVMLGALITGGAGGPAGWLLVPGWLIFATSLANTWWPDRWRPERFRAGRSRAARSHAAPTVVHPATPAAGHGATPAAPAAGHAATPVAAPAAGHAATPTTAHTAVPDAAHPAAEQARATRRSAARDSYREFLAASGRAFRGERD